METIKYIRDSKEYLRSSAIFYFYKSDKLKTIISFMNYWKVKRNINVKVKINVRTMKGLLIKKRLLNFQKSNVINYDGNDLEKNFEGSVEVEVFSNKNLVIPYAAIMAIYNSKKAMSMTHSYSRIYSKKEILDKDAISTGEEACWTIRDTKKIKSFCVFHNGDKICKKQKIKLEITNYLGNKIKKKFFLHELKPYETVKLYCSSHFKNLTNFLKKNPGSASISFKLSNSFTRMLIGNENIDLSEFQTTHSNFNYSKKKTPGLKSNNGKAVMLVPHYGLKNQKILLYPNYTNGKYLIHNGKKKIKISESNRKLISIKSKNIKITIEKKNGKLPLRFVTAFSSKYKKNRIPIEVSRNTRHSQTPPKRFFFAPCISSKYLKTKIIINPYRDFCSMKPENCFGIFKFYCSNSNKIIVKKYMKMPLRKFNSGLDIDEIIGTNAKNFFSNKIGYFTFFSPYTSFDVVSLIRNKENEAVSAEHSF